MFTVLHSSAGAGKTHNLVKNYLCLAFMEPGPEGYAQILALTFTNKAAAEMRERVLKYLEALTTAPQHLKGAEADVRDAIMERAGIAAAELPQRAKAMLSHILHHWPRMTISTIDAFTRRVVTPFARDLQLDHELRMTTEEEYYRAKAVDLLLEEAGSDPALTSVLVAACEQLLEQEQAWRPERPLLALSKQLGQEAALKHLEQLKDISSGQFLDLLDVLRQRTSAFRGRMRKLGGEVLAAIDNAGLSEGDLAGGKNGVIVYFKRLRDFDLNADLGKAGPKAKESGVWHQAKATAAARAAIDGLAPMFLRAVTEVEDLRGTEMRAYLIERAVMRDLLATATLHSIGLRLEDLKREEGISFFSDLTRKVMAIVQQEPAPFLYERLGERYRHFLIDEFQDTSLMQWQAMLPLVENALASDGSVLLVGDAKQAIYRWRNGEARQFTDFPKVFAKEALAHGDAYEASLIRAFKPVEPLAENRRSARGIIAFNNALAERLKQELDEQERRNYRDHEQLAVHGEEGYVEVGCYTTKKDGEEEQGGPWELMVKAVKECLEDGFRPGDIAVLVRTGAQGATASRHLTAEGWNVVSPDGLKLGNDPAVCAVLHILKWLHRPEDERAAPAAQAIAALGSESPGVDPFPDGLKPGSFMRRWQAEHPLVRTGGTLLTLVCRIAEAIHHHPATDVFIMGLVEEAHAFSKANGEDLPGFLEHWDRTACLRSVGGNPGSGAIQVMTIHKAKGLEFPVAIVPAVGAKAAGGGGERIWIDPRPVVEQLPAALVAMNKDLQELGIPEVDQEVALRKLDQLDVLYVAVTRAARRLYISVNGTSSDFMAAALCDHLSIGPGERWASGQRTPVRAGTDREAGTAEAGFRLSATAQGERSLAIRREAPEDWDPVEPDPYRRYGNTVHAILARVRTPEDLPAAVAAEEAAGGGGADALKAIGEHLQLLLAKPELAPFFGQGLEVIAESTLVDAQGHAHRPDRIVRQGPHLRVLDIKTGAPHDRHAEQVRGYMGLLQEVEERPVEGWLLYVREGALVSVAR